MDPSKFKTSYSSRDIVKNEKIQVLEKIYSHHIPDR